MVRARRNKNRQNANKAQKLETVGLPQPPVNDEQIAPTVVESQELAPQPEQLEAPSTSNAENALLDFDIHSRVQTVEALQKIAENANKAVLILGTLTQTVMNHIEQSSPKQDQYLFDSYKKMYNAMGIIASASNRSIEDYVDWILSANVPNQTV